MRVMVAAGTAPHQVWYRSPVRIPSPPHPIPSPVQGETEVAANFFAEDEAGDPGDAGGMVDGGVELGGSIGQAVPRRSGRIRRKPVRFTYGKLGEPSW